MAPEWHLRIWLDIYYCQIQRTMRVAPKVNSAWTKACDFPLSCHSSSSSWSGRAVWWAFRAINPPAQAYSLLWLLFRVCGKFSRIRRFQAVGFLKKLSYPQHCTWEVHPLSAHIPRYYERCFVDYFITLKEKKKLVLWLLPLLFFCRSVTYFVLTE